MTQASQTTPITNKNVVLSFLSAIKADLKQGNGKGDLFAAFLAETKASSPEPVAPKIMADAAPRNTKPHASSSDVKANAPAEKASQAQEDPKAQAVRPNEETAKPVLQRAQENKKDVKNNQENKAAPQEEVTVKQSVSEAPEEEVVEAATLMLADEALVSDTPEIEEEGNIDDALLALVSVISPLDETAPVIASETVTPSEEKANEDMANAATLLEAEIKSMIQLQRERPTEKGKTEKAHTEHENGIKTAIESALAVKAGQRVAPSEKPTLVEDTAQALGATEDAGLVSTRGATLALEEDVYAKNRTTESLDFKDLVSLKQDKETTSLNPQLGVASGENAKKAVETLIGNNASAKTTAISETGSTNVMGGGPRSAEPYAFASQLSAVRVTKGGATGLPTPVEQIAVQVNKMAKDGKEEMTINLKPAELGKIQIKLEFSADHKVMATVTADNQNALDLLMKDQGGLTRALTDAGLQVDAGSLQFSLNENQKNKNLNPERLASSKTTKLLAENDDLAMGLDLETYYVTPGRVNLRV